MAEVKVLFNKENEVVVPTHISIVLDYGIESFWVEDRPSRRLEGRYLHLKGDKEEIQLFLNEFSDVYTDWLT